MEDIRQMTLSTVFISWVSTVHPVGSTQMESADFFHVVYADLGGDLWESGEYCRIKQGKMWKN